MSGVVPTAPVPPRRRSLLEWLLAEPSRFSFDAAIAVMMRASGRRDPAAAVRFRAATGLGFVAADILAVDRDDGGFRATTGLLGLTGSGGVLPRPYTEIAIGERRRRSTSFADFLDMLAQRPIAQFAAAAIKYRPHRATDAASIETDRSADAVRSALLALAGHASDRVVSRLPIGADPLLFYAGAFAMRPRSADRLAWILSDWLGRTVEVEEFAGSWLTLERDQVSALPRGRQSGQFNRLGIDTAAGARVWDIQSRIVLRVGPLPLAEFEAMLPGRRSLARLVSFARLYLDGEIGFAVNPVLAAEAVPAPVLGQGARHLGWNCWLPKAGGRRQDAADAVFAAEDLEMNGTGR